MEEFISSHEPSQHWDESLQNELVEKVEECIRLEQWQEFESLAIASRVTPWRSPLADPRIMDRLLIDYVFPPTCPNDHPVCMPAIRIAGNCCGGDERAHKFFQEHMPELNKLLYVPAFSGIMIGVLANMLYGEQVTESDPRMMLENGIHDSLCQVTLRSSYIGATHPFFSTFTVILETLSEEDLDLGVPNANKTKSAMSCLGHFLCDDLACDSEITDTLVRIFLRWASRRELRTSCTYLAAVYQALIPRLPAPTAAEVESTSILEPFESILSQLATECAEDVDGISKDVQDELWKTAESFVVGHGYDDQTSWQTYRLRAMGYLILCNMCNDELAIKAVQKDTLHEAAIAALRDGRQRANEGIRTNAAGLLNNLCLLKSNREIILESTIVCELFYDMPDVEKELPLKIMRKLVSLAYAPAADAALQKDKLGVPHSSDVLALLPDQRKLQDELAKQQPEMEGLGQRPKLLAGEQLTLDIAHIYCDIRRVKPEVNAFASTELVWAFVTLLISGHRTKNRLSVNEGIFGLGLVILDDKVTEENMAREAIEAVTYTNGLVLMMQMVEEVKEKRKDNEGEKEIELVVGRNIQNIIKRLVEVAKQEGSTSSSAKKLRAMVTEKSNLVH